MKKWIGVALMVVCCVSFLHALRQGVFNGTVEGTEQVWYGTVTDRAMDKIDWNARFSRWQKYIHIITESGEEKSFRFACWCDSKAVRGDAVEVETAIEKRSGLPIVTKVTVLGEISE